MDSLHFVNKGIAQFFKIQNKGKNSNKNVQNFNIISAKCSLICGMVHSVNYDFK